MKLIKVVISPLITLYNKCFTLVKRYWSDPVWSKVIASIIIALGGFLFVMLKSIYDHVSFKSVIVSIVKYLKQTTEINNLLMWIILGLFVAMVISLAKKRLSYIRNRNAVSGNGELPSIGMSSNAFFSYRLAKAFPGQRGLKWYDAKIAVNRFKIIFKEPIKFQPSESHGIMSEPIWWFRGGRSGSIIQFKVLSKSKVLLGNYEFEIDRIAVYVSEAYDRCFIYVETKAESQIGVNNLTVEHIHNQISQHAFYREEYGLLKNRAITREQFDDKAAEINGKIVDASDAELRVRYLSNYNFIITAKQSPYNSQKFDRGSEDYFNQLLKKVDVIDDFFSFLDTIEKREY